jgi:hypothetical protein
MGTPPQGGRPVVENDCVNFIALKPRERSDESQPIICAEQVDELVLEFGVAPPPNAFGYIIARQPFCKSPTV